MIYQTKMREVFLKVMEKLDCGNCSACTGDPVKESSSWCKYLAFVLVVNAECQIFHPEWLLKHHTLCNAIQKFFTNHIVGDFKKVPPGGDEALSRVRGDSRVRLHSRLEWLFNHHAPCHLTRVTNLTVDNHWKVPSGGQCWLADRPKEYLDPGVTFHSSSHIILLYYIYSDWKTRSSLWTWRDTV